MHTTHKHIYRYINVCVCLDLSSFLCTVRTPAHLPYPSQSKSEPHQKVLKNFLQRADIWRKYPQFRDSFAPFQIARLQMKPNLVPEEV